MQVTMNATRFDGLARLEEMLQRSNKVAEKKIAAKAQPAPTVPNTVNAADDVDQAYGEAISILGAGAEASEQHSLDPARVAELLGL